MSINYYEILGVPKESTDSEIRKAYYKLAIINHPDKFTDDKKEEATKRFLIISEAYEVLSDNQKRAIYDNQTSHQSVPKPPETPQIVEVTGKVVYTNPKNKTLFHIFTENSKKKFKCVCESFFPVKVGDAITGIAEYKNNILTFNVTPFCFQGRDQDTIEEFLINSLRGQKMTQKVISGKVNSFLNDLISKNTELDESITHLDKLSTYMKYNSSEIGSVDPNNIDTYTLELKYFYQIINSWYKGRVLRNLYLLGLNNKEINQCKTDPLLLYEQCLKNPYSISSITLEKADNISLRCGKDVDDKMRECGRIIRKIGDLMDKNGWTGIPSSTIIKLFPHIKNYLTLLRDEFGITIEYDTVYLSYAYEVESSTSEWILKLLNSNPICTPTEIEFTRKDLSEEQRAAVYSALNNNISIITGPGGSGKSHTIKEIVYNLEKNGIPYRLASFTGRAVARIREITGKKEACTLHMMIAMNKKLNYSSHKGNNSNKNYKYLLLDESSMITTELLYEFRKVFTHDYRLVFIGDCNQLQPIGWGSLFESLIKSKKIPTTVLTTVHRTDNNEDNGILLNSRKIIQYKDQKIDDRFEFSITQNFKIIDGTLDTVKQLIEVLNNNGIENKSIVIISPYNKDLEILNATCSNLYNGLNRFTKDARGKIWRISDRVMVTENNYKNNVLTGDEGIVIDVDEEAIKVKFKSSEHIYLLSSVSESDETENSEKDLNTEALILSFACSVHRLQGSEANYVIGYIPKGSPSSTFLNSNLLYTLITRARKIVWLIGDVETMERSAIAKSAYRCENLVKRLLV